MTAGVATTSTFVAGGVELRLRKTGCVDAIGQNAVYGAAMLLAALFALHGLTHQICDDGAFVLAFKNRVERVFDVFRDAEIDGRHG